MLSEDRGLNEALLSRTAMKLLVSFSGESSKNTAEGLRFWLPSVFGKKVEPWVSSADIPVGVLWDKDLIDQLKRCVVAVLCVTPDSLESPWVLFEAGAVAAHLDRTLVCPYLLHVRPDELPEPLKQFQAATADERGTRDLLLTINGGLGGEQMDSTSLLEAFASHWEKLEESMTAIANASPALRRRRMDAVRDDELRSNVDFLLSDDCLEHESDAVRLATVRLLERRSQALKDDKRVMEALGRRMNEDIWPNVRSACERAFLRYFDGENYVPVQRAMKRGSWEVLGKLFEDVHTEASGKALLYVLEHGRSDLQDLCVQKIGEWPHDKLGLIADELLRVIVSGRLRDEDIIRAAAAELYRFRPDMIDRLVKDSPPSPARQVVYHAYHG